MNIYYPSRDIRNLHERPFPVPPPISQGADLNAEGAAMLRLVASVQTQMRPLAIGSVRAILETLAQRSASPAAAEDTFISQMLSPAVESLLREDRHGDAEELLAEVVTWKIPKASLPIGASESGAGAMNKLRRLVQTARKPDKQKAKR